MLTIWTNPKLSSAKELTLSHMTQDVFVKHLAPETPIFRET